MALRALGILAPLAAVLVALACNGFLGPHIDALLQRAVKSPADGLSQQVFVLSEDPVVVYIKDFISPEEAAHLVRLAQVPPC